jgi:hypothetical protein
VRMPRIGASEAPSPFTEERILAEGQKDGERNIPEMHSYMPAPFEQALIAHGEQEVHQIFQEVSFRIAKRQPTFQAMQRTLDDLERRWRPVAEGYRARAAELGRDAAAPFPPIMHWALIAFLGIGEFPLNTVVFRLFGEAEYLTYVMASTLAIMIPLIGVFIGIHLRHSIPRRAGNIVIGALAPITVGAALYAVSVLRNTYIASTFSTGPPPASDQAMMAYALFAAQHAGLLWRHGRLVLRPRSGREAGHVHQSLKTLDRRRNAVRTKLFKVGMQINAEIQSAKSQVEQIRALTSQRVALYRQTNVRFRRLLPPSSFRRNPEFPKLEWWPEAVVNSDQASVHGR